MSDELIRELVDERHTTSNERQRKAFRESWGVWADRDDFDRGDAFAASVVTKVEMLAGMRGPIRASGRRTS